MNSNTNIAPSSRRITSIDALRAFALLGILLVHTAQLYNFDNELNAFDFSPHDSALRSLLLLLLEGKCRTIFSILFGVSFYLILRNPAYTIRRFCWRCVLLMGFGLFNQLFFSTDILFWYGFNGLLLALLPVRRTKPVYILCLAVLFFVLGMAHVVPNGLLGADLQVRYDASQSLWAYLSYPFHLTVAANVQTFLAEGTSTLACFVFGYFLGRVRFVEHINEQSTVRHLLLLALLSALAYLCYRHYGYHPVLRSVWNLLMACLYSLSFVFVYKHTERYLSALQKYGKLGLTNYSVQNILMPVFLLAVALPCHLGLWHIVLCALLFYAGQVVFSVCWLRHHAFGPWEGLWRRLTRLV